MPITGFGKRVKSFLISFFSIAVAALVATIVSPEGAAALVQFKSYILALGVPASLVTLAGLFLSEIVREYLNRRKMEKSSRNGEHYMASRHSEEDLY